mgnify:CR=1 FL=1
MTVTDDRPRIVQFPALKEAQEKLDAKRDQLASALREAGPNLDMNLVKSMSGNSTAKVEQLKAWNAEIEVLKKDVDEKLVLGKSLFDAQEHEAAREAGTHREESGPEIKGGSRQRFGDQVLKSDAIKSYKPGMGVRRQSRIDVELNTLYSTSNGWDPEDTRTDRLAEYPTRPAPRSGSPRFPQPPWRAWPRAGD